MTLQTFTILMLLIQVSNIIFLGAASFYFSLGLHRHEGSFLKGLESHQEALRAHLSNLGHGGKS